MPRPIPETPLRKLLAQSIMWLILGATIGGAALVDRAKRAAMFVQLGEPVTLDGFSIRLPKGWEESAPESQQILTELIDEPTERVLTVSAQLPSFGGMFSRSSGMTPRVRPTSQRIPFGDGQEGELVLARVRKQGYEPIDILTATRPLANGLNLRIELQSVAVSRSGPAAADLDLIKRIAASVHVAETSP